MKGPMHVSFKILWMNLLATCMLRCLTGLVRRDARAGLCGQGPCADMTSGGGEGGEGPELLRRVVGGI